MKLNNLSIENFRQDLVYRKVRISSKILPFQCFNTFQPLKQCLGDRVLAIRIDQSGCDQTQFKANCPGVWRRHFIQQTYREQINRDMYDQKKLDEYYKLKNDFHIEFMFE